MVETSGKITKEQAEEVYTQYSEFVYKTAMFIMKSKSAAEDIMQETFIKVFRNYDLYDSRKPIEPWLYRITVNTAKNMLRKQKWLSFIGSFSEQGCDKLVEADFSIEQEKGELLQLINKLPLKSKEVIFLHFYLGMKLNEVSVFLNIPLGTCKSRLNYALTVLRSQYREQQKSEIKGGEFNEAI